MPVIRKNNYTKFTRVTENSVVEQTNEKNNDVLTNDDNSEKKQLSQTSFKENLALEKINLEKPIITREGGVITIVNTSKNGKRIHLSRRLVEELSLVNTCHIGVTNDSLVISNEEIENSMEVFVRKMGKKSVVYSSSFIDFITKKFKLNFNSKSCITFKDFEKVEIEKTKAFIIKIRSEEDEN